MKYQLLNPLSSQVVIDSNISFGAKGMYCFMCEFSDHNGCYTANFPPEDERYLLELANAGYIEETKGDRL